MPAVGNLPAQRQTHELFGRWRHIFEALPEGNDGEAEALKVLDHLCCTPAVKGNLTNVVAGTEFFNEALYKAVVDDVALGRLQIITCAGMIRTVSETSLPMT